MKLLKQLLQQVPVASLNITVQGMRGGLERHEYTLILGIVEVWGKGLGCIEASRRTENTQSVTAPRCDRNARRHQSRMDSHDLGDTNKRAEITTRSDYNSPRRKRERSQQKSTPLKEASAECSARRSPEWRAGKQRPSLPGMCNIT